jgi:hypothetical protein
MEKQTKVMTQSGKHRRAAAFEREEVVVAVKDVDDGDVGLELGPVDDGRGDGEEVVGVNDEVVP